MVLAGISMLRTGSPLIRLVWYTQGSMAHTAALGTSQNTKKPLTVIPGTPMVYMAKRAQSSLAQPATVESFQGKVKPFKAMPAPPEWPVLAHLHLMMKKESQERMNILLERLRDELGDIYRVTVPGQGDMVVVHNPEDVKTYYNNDGKIPLIPDFDLLTYLRVNTMKDRYVSTGLLVNNENWYEVRTKVQQDMMRPQSAFYYIAEMEDIALELVEKIQRDRRDDQVMDPYRALQEYTLEAVGYVFMGVRLGTLRGDGDGQRLIEINEEILPLSLKLFFLPTWIMPYLPSFKKMVTLSSESFDICKKHVDAAIDRVTEEDDSLLAKLVRKCGKESGIPLIMGVDALQVGIDTTGSSASFLLYHLASNPEKQEKLYEEICEIIGPNGAMSEKALSKMKYMKACQTESQRMLPAVFGSSRKTTVDMVLGGYQVPAGTTILRNGHSMSNDPRQFPEPKKFFPERWLRDCPERTTAHPFANIPFGHGTRSCAGRRFAQLELYILMVKVIQRFRLEYDGPEVDVITQFVSVPDKQINIKFIERST